MKILKICKCFITILPLVFISERNLCSKVKTPIPPFSPVINFNDNIEKNNNEALNILYIKMKLKSKVPVYGFLKIPLTKIQLVNGKKLISTFRIKEIVSLEIKAWKGSRRRKGEFVYYPMKYLFQLKNGRSFIHHGNIQVFNKLILFDGKQEKDQKRKGVYYTYFYDYEKSKRKSSMKLSAPMGTVCSIEVVKLRKFLN